MHVAMFCDFLSYDDVMDEARYTRSTDDYRCPSATLTFIICPSEYSLRTFCKNFIRDGGFGPKAPAGKVRQCMRQDCLNKFRRSRGRGGGGGCHIIVPRPRGRNMSKVYFVRRRVFRNVYIA